MKKAIINLVPTGSDITQLYVLDFYPWPGLYLWPDGSVIQVHNETALFLGSVNMEHHLERAPTEADPTEADPKTQMFSDQALLLKAVAVVIKPELAFQRED